jgi:hypothetical protein
LPEYPVSPSQRQDSGAGPTIPATDGLSLPEWYSRLLQASASSRTSPPLISSGTTGRRSDHAFGLWASKLRRASSQRRRSALRTFGNASSGWPTAQAYSHGDSNQPGQVKLDLAAKDWPSPQAHDVRTRGNTEADHHYSEHDLSNAVLNWSSPTTAPEAPNKGSNMKNGPPSRGLAAELWQTPDSGQFTTRRQVRHTERDELLLAGQAKAWATPTWHDGRRPGSDATSTQGRNLKRESEAWGTPTSRDWKDGAGVTENVPTNGLLSRQVLRTETAGSAGLPSGRVLNPQFVEMLMGWPVDLTS